MIGIVAAFGARVLLVLLFFPFSALDKALNFKAAVGQASEATANAALARALILIGLAVELLGSLAILTGFFDCLAGFILAGYCGVTALLWKQFWRAPDFRLIGPSKGREMFWDFLKNFAVAGGFLMLVTAGTASGVERFLQHPLDSTHPYRIVAAGP